MYYGLSALVAAMSLSVSVGHAYDLTTKVNTPAGLLSARSATKAECATQNYPFDCQVIELGGRVLFANAYMSIDEIYPTSDNPKVVIASSSNVGNCCKPETLVFDFTQSPPLILRNVPYYNSYDKDAKLAGFANGVIYKGYSDDTTDLGEPVWKVYRYTYGTGKVVVVRSTVKYDFTPLTAKKYPSDILNDPVQRVSLINVIGRGQFKKFHENIGVESPLERIANRYVVGHGCLPHSCDSNEAIFVLDTLKSDALAISYSTDYRVSPPTVSGRQRGSFGADDAVPKLILSRWMTEHGLSATATMYLPYTPPSSPVASSIPGKRTEVALVTDSGVLTVPALVNGMIPLHFVLDSGASDVSIPADADVVLTLMRTGTITESEFIGTAKDRMADGSVVSSTTFRLRSIKVGDRVEENVVASMTGAEGALLLGQSFLGRFQRWSINNARQALELE
jgi:predicted aspartyl protease